MERNRLFPTIMAALLLGASASAQISVTESGQTRLGTFKQDLTAGTQSLPVNPGTGLGGDIDIPSLNVNLIDTAANLVVLGRHADNGGGQETPSSIENE